MLFHEFIPRDAHKDMLDFLEMMAVSVYAKLDDPLDKFILMGVYEMNYPKEDIAECLGISYTAVYKRLEKIKTLIDSKYEPSKSLKITTGKGRVYKHYYKRMMDKDEQG